MDVLTNFDRVVVEHADLVLSRLSLLVSRLFTYTSYLSNTTMTTIPCSLDLLVDRTAKNILASILPFATWSHM